jgi:hypothetical protein
MVPLVIAKSAETIGESCFRKNQTLESFTFEADSDLQRSKKEAFG